MQVCGFISLLYLFTYATIPQMGAEDVIRWLAVIIAPADLEPTQVAPNC